jgi:hypothetical protein
VIDAFAMLETFHPNETLGLHMLLVASKWRDEVILVIHSRSFVRRRARREVATSNIVRSSSGSNRMCIFAPERHLVRRSDPVVIVGKADSR